MGKFSVVISGLTVCRTHKKFVARDAITVHDGKVNLKGTQCKIDFSHQPKPCLHVTFFNPLFNNDLLLFSIVSMGTGCQPLNNGHNG